jgi:hypothetical protein
MEEDHFRKKGNFKLYCSVHPKQELSFSGKMSRVGADSAYEINIDVVVHPCAQCKAETDRIKNAATTLFKAANS